MLISTGLCSENLTMLETLLSTKYEDFVFDDTDIAFYKALSEQFEKELQDYNINLLDFSLCCEIPDTYSQTKSPRWNYEQIFRITASICRTVVNLGESISPNDSMQPHLNYLEKQLWFPSSFLNSHMTYGINNEVIAVKHCCNAKQTSVKWSGIWINADYVHLAASPDGLIYDDSNKLCGIVEIKCLNILRWHSMEDIVKKNCPDAEIKMQCFIIDGGKLTLKRARSYFYQAQLQLIVAMAYYCDIALFSAKDPHSIERIFPDAELQKRLAIATKRFWKKVLVPEYYLITCSQGLSTRYFCS